MLSKPYGSILLQAAIVDSKPERRRDHSLNNLRADVTRISFSLITHRRFMSPLLRPFVLSVDPSIYLSIHHPFDLLSVFSALSILRVESFAQKRKSPWGGCDQRAKDQASKMCLPSGLVLAAAFRGAVSKEGDDSAKKPTDTPTIGRTDERMTGRKDV